MNQNEKVFYQNVVSVKQILKHCIKVSMLQALIVRLSVFPQAKLIVYISTCVLVYLKSIRDSYTEHTKIKHL